MVSPQGPGSRSHRTTAAIRRCAPKRLTALNVACLGCSGFVASGQICKDTLATARDIACGQSVCAIEMHCTYRRCRKPLQVELGERGSRHEFSVGLRSCHLVKVIFLFHLNPPFPASRSRDDTHFSWSHISMCVEM